MSRAYPNTLLRKIDELVARYPKREAALIPVLRLVQDEAGCLSPDEEEFVARTLGLTSGNVYEVAIFQAERQTTGSTYQLTLTGFSLAPSRCTLRRCTP